MFQSFLTPVPVNLITRPALRCQIVTDPASLARLAPSWRALLLESGRPEPMQGPDWALPWWERYTPGGDYTLRLGLFWEGARLVGLAPLCRRTFRYRGGIPFRRLEWLGSDSDQADGVCSEYLGLIALPTHENQVIETFAREVNRGALGPWDELVLAVLDGSRRQTQGLIEAFRHHDLPVQAEAMTAAPFVTLPNSWDGFLKQLSKSKRWNLKTQLKDFEAWAQGKAAWHEARTPEELNQGKAILKELHEVRWRGEGKSGAFASARFSGFHDRYMAHLLEEGKLELIWLTVQEKPVAALYGFREGGKVYFYQSGRVTDLPERIRIGSVIVAQAIRRAIARGDGEFDLLGGPARYKLAFTDKTRPLTRLRVARPGLLETVRNLGEKVLHGMRWLRTWWRSEQEKPPTSPGAQAPE